MGGMLALEMVPYLRPAAVILIASCRSGAQIRWLRLYKLLFPLVPRAAFRFTRRLGRALEFMLGRLSAEQRRVFQTMMDDLPIDFLCWGCRAILQWRPAGRAEPTWRTPVFQIHGSADRLIPAARVQADEIVPGAGHLVNLTHPEAVNAFIRRHLLPD